jgi:two-component system, NarL family, sensor histidine kinase DesK
VTRERTPVQESARLTRGVQATWWYTLTAVLFFELMMAFLWGAGALARGPEAALGVGIAGLLWVVSTVPLLLAYRHRTDQLPGEGRVRVILCLGAAVAAGVVAGWLSGSWLVAVVPAVQSLVLLNWPPGVRLRVVIGAVVVLGVLWLAVDGPLEGVGALDGWLLGFYSTVLPVMSVSSLWWWDVLVTLDRARAVESRYAASQERLRVATDVHDLQGHHLQVIALQLELVDRLRDSDPDAAAEHLRAARASVDAARQGTRDLAQSFRSVALPDELANAVDLLRAAGATVQATVTPDADAAPADVLGPVIRETTTNALRHGGGRWARLELVRTDEGWRYEIANDAEPPHPISDDGSGLDGMRRRAEEAGGTLEVSRLDGAFTVRVTVPGSAA